MAARGHVIRVDQDVRARLDEIREQYGDRNYSEAVRRALRWNAVVKGSSSVSGSGAAAQIRDSHRHGR